MEISIKPSFQREAKKLNSKLQTQLKTVIESILNAKNTNEISNCTKMVGFKNAYRIKMKNYRIGFYLQNQVVELVRVMDRKEIYKWFPD